MTQRGSGRMETKLIKASVSPRHYGEFSGMLKCTSTTTLTPKVLLITANVFAKFSLLLANSRLGGLEELQSRFCCGDQVLRAPAYKGSESPEKQQSSW